MAGGRPSREQVFESFDRSLADLGAVGGLPLPIEAEGIWEGVLHEETHHSTAIEGNTVVLRQVKALLQEGRATGNKELREYLEISGYADAARWVYNHAIRKGWQFGDGGPPTLITRAEVCEVHRRVMEPAWTAAPPDGARPEEGPGGFRRCEIQPLRAGLTPLTWPLVEPEFETWRRAANQPPSDDVHLTEYLADLHAGFERIHPFRDGNGRVGRLVLNLLLVRYGAPPAILYKRNRAQYLRALARADGGDPGPLGEIIARAVRHSIERFLLPELAGPSRMVPLASLGTPELSHVALQSAAKRGRLRAVRAGNQWYSNQKSVSEYKRSRKRGRRPREAVG